MERMRRTAESKGTADVAGAGGKKGWGRKPSGSQGLVQGSLKTRQQQKKRFPPEGRRRPGTLASSLIVGGLQFMQVNTRHYSSGQGSLLSPRMSSPIQKFLYSPK